MSAPVAASVPPRISRSPLGLPRVFWLLWVGMLVNRLGGGVFAFLSLYLTGARGLSPALAGLVVGLYAGGGMVAGPVGGLCADRLGRRTTLLIGSSCAALVMLGLGLARAQAFIVPLAFALGFFTDLCRPALQAAVADVVAPADRRRAYGLLYWATNLGFSGAAAAAGLLATWSYTLLFVVDALTTLFFGGLVFLTVPETRPPEAPAGERLPHLRQVAVPFRDRRFVVFAVIQYFVILVFAQFSVAFPLDMSAHGLSPATIGRVLALNGLVIIALQPVALRLFPRAAHHHLLAAGAALTGLGFGVSALAPPASAGPEVYWVAVVVLTCGEIAFSLAVPALLADLAPAAHRGGYQGAHQLTWGFAGLTAPALGSFVFQAFGATPLWLGCAGVGLVTAGLHATLTGRTVRGGR